MADGFLGRWAQRKQAVREGQPVVEPVLPAVRPELFGSAQDRPVEGPLSQTERGLRPAQPERTEAEAPAAPPTLQDTQALTPQSDFRRFVAADVDPEVKHAAMRKLFADPHFNVMDGLDIYIDDYNKPDPLPDSMLRQMASAQFLGLVEEEKPEPVATTTGPMPTDHATSPEGAPVAEPLVASAAEPDETQHHDDPDLRLQQDHAPGPQGSGRGA